MRILFLILLCALLNNNIYGQGNKTQQTEEPSENQDVPEDEGPIKKNKIVVAPTIVYFKLEPGQQSTQPINIINSTDKPYQFRLLMKDWERDSLGRHNYFLAGAHPRSCARWLKADKTFIEVMPGEIGRVNLTMSVPDTMTFTQRGDTIETNEMKWTMVLIETVSEKTVSQKHGKVTTKIGKSSAIGVHVYQTPPVLEKNKEVKMLSFQSLNDDKHYRIIGANKGAIQLRCSFNVELISHQTGDKITMEPKIVPLFPMQTRYVDFELPKTLAKGRYTAVAIIDTKDDEVPLEAAELEIEIK